MTSLGTYLKSLRLDVDLNIQSVSNKIKVRTQILDKIENDQKIDRPKVIVKSYILNYGKTVGADQKILLEKFDELYQESPAKNKITLPAKKEISNFLIWSMVFVLLALSIGLAISNKNQLKTASTDTYSYKRIQNTDQQNLYYSTPETIQDILSSPNPSSDKNK